jgi:hypothetical protein
VQALLPNPQMQLPGAWAPRPPRGIIGSLGRGGFGRPPQLICMALGNLPGSTHHKGNAHPGMAEHRNQGVHTEAMNLASD